MNIPELNSLISQEYLTNIRRKLHMYPEVGFDLPKTIALVKSELDAMGVQYTEKYGKSSVVATINEHKENFTIGIRADMDALPIQEKNDVPYKSRHDGKMHACGHDAHTAILLGTVKALNQIKDEIDCRVMFLFQPSEEGARSGAKLMVEDGVMDNIDIIIACHTDNAYPVGKVGFINGPALASNRVFEIEISGKTAHAVMPHTGIDAIAVAHRIYGDIHLMLAREMDPFALYAFNIGTIQGGTAVNVVAAQAKMTGTLRTHCDEVDAYVAKRMEDIVTNVAREVGATTRVVTKKTLPPVYNDEKINKRLMDAAAKVVGRENVFFMEKPKMSSEDFSMYLTKKPGVFFRICTRNEDKGFTGMPHNSDWQIDEDALPIGVKVFTQFVIDNMGGLEREAK